MAFDGLIALIVTYVTVTFLHKATLCADLLSKHKLIQKRLYRGCKKVCELDLTFQIVNFQQYATCNIAI